MLTNTGGTPIPITAKDIAKMLNISPAAVSMALNHKPGVSRTTREQVLELARRYEYNLPQREYRQIQEKEGTICFAIYKKSGAVVSDTPFFSNLSEGISEGCKLENYALTIAYIYEYNDIALQIKELVDSNYSGIILLATEMQQSDIKPFLEIDTPLLILDSYFETIPRNTVIINNKQGAFVATDYLISRCKSQPGYLRSAYPIGNFEERADGFYKAIRANGMSTSKSIVHRLAPSEGGAYADMKQFIQSGEELARCYFADNDHIAIGVITALKEAGYRIPEDISIIGFDDLPQCNCMAPRLTTIQVPKRYMGKLAARQLITSIEEHNHTTTKTEINTLLVKRHSTL